jgi:hypothetical protein
MKYSLHIILLLLMSSSVAWGQTETGNLIVVSDRTENGFPLVDSGRTTTIYIDPNDAAVVRIAAEAFRRDVERVTDCLPDLKMSTDGLSKQAIIIGTLGRSGPVNRIAQSGKFPAGRIRSQWETFAIGIVEHPIASVERALVVAGSDRRGTAFGVFELSRMIGVSPWVWWADVAPRHRDALYLTGSAIVEGPPSVKYRGIFLNDEDWGLQPWAAKNMDTDIHDIGPKTYARIFELLLRLKANFIWPAMHPCTKAFHYYPDNPKVADQYAIVVGASHCEPMLRNNVFEWAENFEHEYGVKPGPWRYDTNREQIYRYWLDRVIQTKFLESVYTVGMRGIHDSGIPGPRDIQSKLALLQRIIRDQRQMLDEQLDIPVKDVPQIFCPYKEVLQIYQAGLKLPDDVTIVWADDNHGYVRQLSTPTEQLRSGGSGVYYHLSYWGAPQDYLWLSSTSPAQVSFEMTKAYNYGARRLWIFNVGDIKPAEMEMEFGLDLAWDITQWPPQQAYRYARSWAERTFGPEMADDIADIKNQYYHLAQSGKPEHIPYITYRPDQIEQRLQDYRKLMQQARSLAAQIPSRLTDAYYQLILYPVSGAALMNEKILCARQSLKHAQQGKKEEALKLAQRAQAAYDQIQVLTEHYNHGIGQGKWDGIMSSHPRDREVFAMPAVATPESITMDSNEISEQPAVPVTLAASDYIKKHDNGEARVVTIPQLGINGSAVTLQPFTSPSWELNESSNAPSLQYRVALTSGRHRVRVKCLPTHRVHEDRQLRYTVSLGDEDPQVVNVDSPSGSRTWSTNVLRGYSEGLTQHRIQHDGEQVLTLRLLDPGLAITCIEID